MTEKHVMLPTSEVLDQIVVEFHKLTSNIYEIPPAKPKEEHYRQVIVKGWPRNIHFEFISRQGRVSVGDFRGVKACFMVWRNDSIKEGCRVGGGEWIHGC